MTILVDILVLALVVCVACLGFVTIAAVLVPAPRRVRDH
jgi:hypothetical protein